MSWSTVQCKWEEDVPREVADAPPLEVLKARLDGASINLVWWAVSLPTADRLELGDL